MLNQSEQRDFVHCYCQLELEEQVDNKDLEVALSLTGQVTSYLKKNWFDNSKWSFNITSGGDTTTIVTFSSPSLPEIEWKPTYNNRVTIRRQGKLTLAANNNCKGSVTRQYSHLHEIFGVWMMAVWYGSATSTLLNVRDLKIISSNLKTF